MRFFAVMLLVLASFPSHAWAINLTFDPGAYDGGYYSPGFFGNSYGVQVRDVPHDTVFEVRTLAGHRIALLSTDASGNLTVLDGANAVSVAPATVTFQTVAVTFDAQTFTGAYSAQGVSKSTGASTHDLPIDTNTHLVHGSGRSLCFFSVNASGNFSFISGASSCTETSPGNLRFEVTSVSIDPGSYVGAYHASGVSKSVGASNHDLIVDSTHRLYISGGGIIGDFAVDAAGTVTVSSGTAINPTGAGSFSLLTSEVFFEPNGYTGPYDGPGVSKRTVAGSEHIPIDSQNRIFASDTPAPEICHYKIDAGGTVTIVSGGTSVTASGSTITFNTVDVEIRAGGYVGQWETRTHGRLIGDHTAKVIVDVRTDIDRPGVEELAQFTVAGDGAVTAVDQGHRIGVGNGAVALRVVEVSATPAPASAQQRIYGLSAYAAGEQSYTLLAESPFTFQDSGGGQQATVAVAGDCSGLQATEVLNGTTYSFACTVPVCTAGEDALPTALVDGTLAEADDVMAQFDAVAAMINGFGGVPNRFVDGTVSDAVLVNQNLEALRAAVGLDVNDVTFAVDASNASAADLMDSFRALANAAMCL